MLKLCTIYDKLAPLPCIYFNLNGNYPLQSLTVSSHVPKTNIYGLHNRYNHDQQKTRVCGNYPYGNLQCSKFGRFTTLTDSVIFTDINILCLVYRLRTWYINHHKDALVGVMPRPIMF